MRSVFLLLVTCLTTGCAQTAVVQCWEPAEIDVTGVNRIVVADFTGEQGEAISAALSASLWENEFYTVVDRSELKPGIRTASFSERPTIQEVLSRAQAAGIDGVILGSVIEHRCDDQILGSTDLNLFQDEADQDGVTTRSNGLTVESNEILLREGTVTIAFRLVDSETGEIRASQQISRHYSGRMENGEGTLPTSGEVLEKLRNQCVNDVVQMLAPHEMSCEIKLATCDFWSKGARDVKIALELASKGDWEGAERHWHEALTKNPENHAAMFNLSIAAARRQEYDIAEQYVLDALRLEHKKCYTQGLETIRERRTAWMRANDQRDARVVSSGTAQWE